MRILGRALPLLPLLGLLLAGCAGKSSLSHDEAVTIGPYAQFTGRLIVMEPNRRWQVLVDWRADHPGAGRVRMTHAASGLVLQLRWQGGQMALRDNRHPAWRAIDEAALAKEGIILPPWDLAAILLGQMPDRFEPHGNGRWEDRRDGRLLRLDWQPSKRKLVVSDIRHGRVATLLIRE